jgi:hypothetical protein
VFDRFEGDDKFTSTGFMPYLDTRTGKKMPGNYINAPPGLGKSKIYFKYTGVKGEEHGPFEIVFDPVTARHEFCKQLQSQMGKDYQRYPGC